MHADVSIQDVVKMQCVSKEMKVLAHDAAIAIATRHMANRHNLQAGNVLSINSCLPVVLSATDVKKMYDLSEADVRHLDRYMISHRRPHTDFIFFKYRDVMHLVEIHKLAQKKL